MTVCTREILLAGKPPLCMFADEFLVRRAVDAVDLVVVTAVHPFDVGTEVAQTEQDSPLSHRRGSNRLPSP
jgi:hypothetical protein